MRLWIGCLLLLGLALGAVGCGGDGDGAAPVGDKAAAGPKRPGVEDAGITPPAKAASK